MTESLVILGKEPMSAPVSLVQHLALEYRASHPDQLLLATCSLLPASSFVASIVLSTWQAFCRFLPITTLKMDMIIPLCQMGH